MLGVLPYFLTILLVTGTAFFILPSKSVQTLMGTESGIRGMLLAAVTGAAALVPVLAVFPVVSELLKKWGRDSADGGIYFHIDNGRNCHHSPGSEIYGTQSSSIEKPVIFSVGICHILSAGGVIMKHKVIKAEMMGPWKAAAAAYLAVFIFIPERSGEIGARAGTGLGQFIWNLVPVFLCVGLMDVWIEKRQK